MRRLTAVLFLSIFILQAFGYFFTYRLLKWHIHKEITKQLSTNIIQGSALTCITFNQTQHDTLIWENENEFCYQEEWYDVVDVKHKENLTTYYCIKDREETKLVASFDSILKDQTQSSSENNFRFTLKKLSDNYYLNTYTYHTHAFIEHPFFSITPTSPVLQVFSSIQDPPPEA